MKSYCLVVTDFEDSVANGNRDRDKMAKRSCGDGVKIYRLDKCVLIPT